MSRVLAAQDSTTPSPSAAPTHVGAGVAEHEPLVQIVEQERQRRTDEDRDAPQRVRAAPVATASATKPTCPP